MRQSRVLYLASRPRPSAIFHIVHKRMRYFNWFILFVKFCAVLELMCRVLHVSSAFWKWNSGRILLKKSSPLASCILGYGILSTTLGMGDWISDGDNDELLFGECISDGDNDDSLTLFHEIGRQQELQNGYWPELCKRHFFFFFGDLRLRQWHFAEGPVTKTLLPLSLRVVGSPCRTAGHRCRHR